MRALVVSLVAVAAGAAVAQPVPPRPLPPVSDIQLQSELNLMRGELDRLRQQQIGINNELTAQDAQLRTQQNLDLLRSLSIPQSTAPQLLPGVGPAAPQAPVGPYISIPDDMLAASNARVRAAAGNRP